MALVRFSRFVLTGMIISAVPAVVWSEGGYGYSQVSSAGEGITGAYLYTTGEKIDTSAGMPVLRYREGIVFIMERDTAVEYSYFLPGPDIEWTSWTERAYKEYTSLDRGHYTFRYRCRNRGSSEEWGGFF